MTLGGQGVGTKGAELMLDSRPSVPGPGYEPEGHCRGEGLVTVRHAVLRDLCLMHQGSIGQVLRVAEVFVL